MRGSQHGWDTFSRLREALEADPPLPRADERARLGDRAQHRCDPACAPRTGRRLAPGGPTRSPDALVLATGAHDRTLPFPGWDLPGVYTAGAAQALAKSEGVALGSQVVVAGAGPFLLPVAASLTATGAEVLGIFEASPVRRMASGWPARPWQLLGAAAKAGELAGYVGHQLRRRIPYCPGHAVVAAHGRRGGRFGDRRPGRRDLVTDRRHRTPTRHRCGVCVSHAFTPRLELPVAAGCWIGADGFVAVDDHQCSTVAGVYAAGEITGVAGADAALAEGAVAGHCAAGGSPTDPRIRESVRARARSRQFAGRMAEAHGIGPGWKDWLTDETLICRCEEVSYGHIRKVAAATPDAGLRSLKLSTRACLGPCQGRTAGVMSPTCSVATAAPTTGRSPSRSGSANSPKINSSRSTSTIDNSKINKQPQIVTDRPPVEGSMIMNAQFDLGGVIVATALAFKEDDSAPAGLAVDYDKFGANMSTS